MKSSQQQLRCLIDRLYKQDAKGMKMPTGKDGRTQEEAMHSGAVARGQAQMASKKANVMRTVPLRELQNKLKTV